MPKLTIPQIEEFLEEHFPAINRLFTIEEIGDTHVRVRMGKSVVSLRPGGTISGPTLMTLADTAMYILVLAISGIEGHAVTTNLNINFLRKPKPVDVIGEVRLLKSGARLIVGDVTMYSDGEKTAVAHATVTYSIPPR
jgi:uncharacterized protein (TIGR00369 family)